MCGSAHFFGTMCLCVNTYSAGTMSQQNLIELSLFTTTAFHLTRSAVQSQFLWAVPVIVWSIYTTRLVFFSLFLAVCVFVYFGKWWCVVCITDQKCVSWEFHRVHLVSASAKMEGQEKKAATTVAFTRLRK